MAPTPSRPRMEVFVELPPLSRCMSSGFLRSKENQPLTPTGTVSSPLTSRSTKYGGEGIVLKDAKMGDAVDSDEGDTKKKNKRKADDDLSSDLTTKKRKPSDSNITDEWTARCHHCRKQVSATVAVRCSRQVKYGQCKLSYCLSCLEHRYNEDLDDIKRQNASIKANSVEIKLHVSGELDVLYSCPRCKGCCNCSVHKKAAGVKLSGRAKEDRITVTSEIIASDNLVPSPIENGGSSATSLLKIPPEPVWSEIPTSLTQEEVEDRIYLREFFARFAPMMSVARLHVDLLDYFEGIGDATVKALVVSLLDLIAIETEGPTRKQLQAGVKAVRAANGLTKIWSVLENMRNAEVLNIPDIASLAINTGTHNTRGTTVARGVQFIPVLLSLCEHVLRGDTLRSEIEERTREHPQFNRDARYGPLKEVNQAWAEKKKALNEEKTRAEIDLVAWNLRYKKAQAEHRLAVMDIEQAHYERNAEYAPRFRSLGRDFKGRVYYILSSCPVKKVPSKHELDNFQRWSWFVAVHGTAKNSDGEDEVGWWGFNAPKEIRQLSKWLMAIALRDTAQPGDQTDEFLPSSPLSSLSDDEDEEIYDDPATQLARYYGPRPPVVETKAMCKRMDEFADYLEWRLAEDDA